MPAPTRISNEVKEYAKNGGFIRMPNLKATLVDALRSRTAKTAPRRRSENCKAALPRQHLATSTLARSEAATAEITSASTTGNVNGKSEPIWRISRHEIMPAATEKNGETRLERNS